MSEPRWLTLKEVLVTHERQLAYFGGPAGVQDQDLLELALLRPVDAWSSARASLAELAAAYAFGISRNHAFMDGNKRTAFAALMVFLRLNGLSFAPSQAEATVLMISLAAGEVDEAGLARWVSDTLEGGG